MSNEEKKIFDWIKSASEEDLKGSFIKSDEDILRYIEILKEGEVDPEEYIKWCGFGDALKMIDEGRKFDRDTRVLLMMLMDTR